MKRTWLVFLALAAGCATAKAPPPELHPPPPITAPDDGLLIERYVSDQNQLLDELEQPRAEARPADCGRTCALVANICDLSGRICAVASRHEGEEAMQQSCQDALDRCSRARLRTSGTCSCPGTR